MKLGWEGLGTRQLRDKAGVERSENEAAAR